MCDEARHKVSDAELVRRAQKGDTGAFEALFERHRRGLLAYVNGMTKDLQAAEDIVQDVFVRLARRLDTINPRRGASPWLYRVARNRAVDHLRKRAPEVLPGEEALREWLGRAGGDNPANALLRTEAVALVREALLSMEPGDRDVLMLRFFGGLRFREIAAVLKRPMGTVLWQSRRSLEKLRRLVEAAGYDATALRTPGAEQEGAEGGSR